MKTNKNDAILQNVNFLDVEKVQIRGIPGSLDNKAAHEYAKGAMERLYPGVPWRKSNTAFSNLPSRDPWLEVGGETRVITILEDGTERSEWRATGARFSPVTLK